MDYKCNKCSRICDDGFTSIKPHGPYIYCPYCTAVLTPVWLQPVLHSLSLRQQYRVAVDNLVIRASYGGSAATYSAVHIDELTELVPSKSNILNPDEQAYIMRLSEAHGLLADILSQYVIFRLKL